MWNLNLQIHLQIPHLNGIGNTSAPLTLDHVIVHCLYIDHSTALRQPLHAAPDASLLLTPDAGPPPRPHATPTPASLLGELSSSFLLIFFTLAPLLISLCLLHYTQPSLDSA